LSKYPKANPFNHRNRSSLMSAPVTVSGLVFP
jgi:hypothetical protein